MVNQIGNFSLIFGFLVSLIIIYFSIKIIKEKKKEYSKNIFSLLSLQFILITSSFLSLIYLFVVSDFSNKTVYNNSHTTKPLFYKVSGTWGNHEGSLLLWLIVLSFFIFLFFLKSKKFPTGYKMITIIIHQFIISGFYLFILFTSNPFEYLYPVPSEGLGLNPILQDPALAFHPPILYIGYVGTSIIFSASLAALIKKNITIEWAKHIKKWIYASWIFLTLGIMLGSIWAYYELGWGGFWFWDPVENVSLMPWFCLTALLHTILVLEKRLLLKSWTLILSIATFSLSMTGTFLVRSGILNSVHTFANDPSRGVFILLFLFLLTIFALVIFFIYSEKENLSEKKTFLISKDNAILINNWFMMFFLSVVLTGTIYPIFLEVLSNEKISIGPPFYQKLILPFMIPFLLFMTIGPKLDWIKTKIRRIKLQQIFFLIFSLIISFSIVKIFNISFLFATLFFSFAFLLFFITINDFFNKKNKISQKISHFAFSVFILSVLLNGVFSKEISSNMKVGDEIKFLDKSIKFKNLKNFEKKNFKSLEAEFEVTQSNNKSYFFYPEIRIYNQPSILTSEADIKTGIFADNFIVFNLLKDDEYFNVKYQFKPFMIWIWISVFFLSLGGFLAFLKK